MAAPFASAEDISARLARALTDDQTSQAELLIDGASAVIADAAGVPAADLDASEIPVLRFVCVEAVCRAIANPEGAGAVREQLGAYSHSTTFHAAADASGLWLTDRERLLVRHAVHGRLSGSSRPVSTADEIHDVIYGS